MAILLPGDISPIPFSAKPFPVKIALETTRPANMPPRGIRIDIDWAADPYLAGTSNPTVAVSVNLTGQGQVQEQVDAIRSVYIDNSDSITPIYVLFPDSSFLVQCPPRSVAWQPVMSAENQKAIIFGVGFVSGLVPTTSVFFSNVAVAGYCISVRGSNLVRGQYNGTLSQAPPASSAISLTSTDFLAKAAPDRIRAAVLFQARTAVAPPVFNNVTINGFPATIAVEKQGASGANSYRMAIAYARAPTGVTFNVGWQASTTPSIVVASLFSIYNANNLVPYDADITTTFLNPGATGAVQNLSPFITQDSFSVLGSAMFFTAGPVGASWQNAFEVMELIGANLVATAAQINDGDDKFVPVQAAPTGGIAYASWN